MRGEDPFLDAGMRGFICNTATANYRKVTGYDFDDLVQEGYVVFYKCREKYRETPWGPLTAKRFPTHGERKWFQSIVKTALGNRMKDLIAKAPAWREQVVSDMLRADDFDNVDVVWERLMPSQEEEATAVSLLASAPHEIKQLFALLVNDAVDAYSRRKARGRRLGSRETTNQYFCRLLGIPSEYNYDIVKAVEDHFLKAR